MRKYRSYKQSGVEWIGDIPEKWRVTLIKYIVDKKITDGPHLTPLFVDENGGVPFLSVESIQNSKIDLSKRRGNISFEDHLEYSKKCKPQWDDILLVKSGSVGKLTIVDINDEFNVWSPLSLIRIKSKGNPRFYFYFFHTDYFQILLKLNSGINTQPNIGMGVIESLKVLSPPLTDQLQIVKFLDEKTKLIDSLISIKDRKINLLKEQRTSLINQVVTKGLSPKLKMKESDVEWIGDIPESWKFSKLGFYTLKIGSGSTPKGGSEVYVDSGIPFIRSQNVHFDGLRLDGISFIEVETHKSMKGSTVVKGDLLLNITGGSIGRCCVVEIDQEMNVNQHVSIIRTTNELINYFLNYFLGSDIGQSQVFFNLTGGNREGLTIEGIRNFIITIPTIEDQLKIVEYLDLKTKEIDDLVQLEHKKIDLLKEYRQSLISEVVTGKIKVTTDE
jgi:type I restriction enzyme S subunit